MRPVFYCENCKREVSARDKVCPGCGRFFTDVRCPRCNHSGEVEAFSLGCPKCGYLNPAWVSAASASASASALFEALPLKMFETGGLAPESPRREPARLPAWLFLSLTIAIGTLCAALAYLFLAA